MKKKKQSILKWFLFFISIGLLIIHSSYFIITFIHKQIDAKYIGSEFLIITHLLLFIILLIYIEKNLWSLNKVIIKYFMLSGIIHVVISLSLPRISGYTHGPIEILTFKSFYFVDGDLFCRGILLILFSYFVKSKYIKI